MWLLLHTHITRYRPASKQFTDIIKMQNIITFIHDFSALSFWSISLTQSVLLTLARFGLFVCFWWKYSPSVIGDLISARMWHKASWQTRPRCCSIWQPGQREQRASVSLLREDMVGFEFCSFTCSELLLILVTVCNLDTFWIPYTQPSEISTSGSSELSRQKMQRCEKSGY